MNFIILYSFQFIFKIPINYTYKIELIIVILIAILIYLFINKKLPFICLSYEFITLNFFHSLIILNYLIIMITSQI
jgi:hypothetical protein